MPFFKNSALSNRSIPLARLCAVAALLLLAAVPLRAVTQYNLIVDTDVEGGSVTGTPSGTYASGTTFTVTATPEADYQFGGWSYNDGRGVFPAFMNPLSLAPSQDLHLTPIFIALVTKYDFVAAAGTGGSVTGTSPGKYVSGTSFSVTALPGSGYTFDGWYNESDVKVSSTLTYSGTITADLAIEARFLTASGGTPDDASAGNATLSALKKKAISHSSHYKLQGKQNGYVDFVYYKVGKGKFRKVAVPRAKTWAIKVKGLQPGKNVIYFYGEAPSLPYTTPISKVTVKFDDE